MFTRIKKLFSILKPQDYATKQLEEAQALLLDTEMSREDALSKAQRCTADIAMLKRRIARLQKMQASDEVSSDVVPLRRRRGA